MNKFLLMVLIFPFAIFSQGYTSYFTGNTTNISTITSGGTCLMGGATEHDNAMRWLLQKANGGDVVVLRSTGGNGYNNYLYTDLGVTVNSVETLVITSIAGALSPYVLDKVANAEMIWFAGGDQFNYVSFFKDNALEDLLNNHINVKHAPIGGTSAGMAILCGKYFSAQNGTITSAQALANPYNSMITLGNNDFLNVPFLQNVTTDTHFDYYNRNGRLTTFLARKATDDGSRSFGIAANEYVAVCVDDTGKASVYGDYPNYQEFAFFVQANCQSTFVPEICQSNTALTWNRSGEAVKVYKVAGTMNGDNYFQLSDWQTGIGGLWEHWTANNGVYASSTGTISNCVLNIDDFSENNIKIFPVPVENVLTIKGLEQATIKIFDMTSKLIFETKSDGDAEINTTDFVTGIYAVSINQNGKTIIKKIVKN